MRHRSSCSDLVISSPGHRSQIPGNVEGRSSRCALLFGARPQACSTIPLKGAYRMRRLRTCSSSEWHIVYTYAAQQTSCYTSPAWIFATCLPDSSWSSSPTSPYILPTLAGPHACACLMCSALSPYQRTSGQGWYGTEESHSCEED